MDTLFLNTPEIRFPNLGINIGHLNDTAINIFGFPIQWYGVIIGCSVFLGLFIVLQEAKRTNQSSDLYFDFFFIVVIACVIGARLYYVIFAWDQYKDNLIKIFAFREGGLAIYGAVITAITTAVIYTKIKKYDFWLFIDTGIFGLIIGQSLGRWGNFFNREAFGRFTDGFLAMQYRLDTVDFSNVTQGIMDNTVIFQEASYIQVHPTFLYESLWNLTLFIGLHIYKKHKAFKGELFMLYLLCYGIGRFWIEGLRTDQLFLFNTSIPVSQLLSLFMVAFSLCFIIYKRINVKKALTLDGNNE